MRLYALAFVTMAIPYLFLLWLLADVLSSIS